MRIAHIAPPWLAIPPKNYGGTEIVIYNLVEEQVAQGHDVTLIAPGDACTSAQHVSFFSKALLDSGVPWQAHLQAYYHLHKAVEYIKEEHFDIVHSHLSSSADMYIFPLMATLSTPHIMTLHSRFPFDRLPDGYVGGADKYYIEWASSVPMIAISKSAREVPYKLNFVGIVHHGLPMEQFYPACPNIDEYFVWLGRIDPDKGTHLAIEAAKNMGVPLVLAGTVDRHSQEAQQYYERLIKPQINGKQIRYIGPVSMQQKIELLSRARGFLNPIQWEEPFGMVMIEAMALGCPVISFARGAAPEIIIHKKTGYLVHTVDEMAECMSSIDEIDRQATRSHIVRNFSIQVMAEKYQKMYERVIATRRVQLPRQITLTRRGKPVQTSISASVKRPSPFKPSLQVSQITRIAAEGEKR